MVQSYILTELVFKVLLLITLLVSPKNQGAMGALKQSAEAGDLSGAAAVAAAAAAGDDEIPDLVEGENFENEVE
ncbi:unnamed protein product [[Candida] boidinii]|nr:unnamed protein product [[Candida] boidinii]